MTESAPPAPPVEKEVPYDPASHPIDESSHTVLITTHKMYKNGGVVTNDEESLEPLSIRAPIAGVEMARVSATARMGVNMGNYETVQLEIAIELPCYVEELADCYKTAKTLVDSKLNKEIQDVRAYRDQRDSSAKQHLPEPA